MSDPISAPDLLWGGFGIVVVLLAAIAFWISRDPTPPDDDLP